MKARPAMASLLVVRTSTDPPKRQVNRIRFGDQLRGLELAVHYGTFGSIRRPVRGGVVFIDGAVRGRTRGLTATSGG